MLPLRSSPRFKDSISRLVGFTSFMIAFFLQLPLVMVHPDESSRIRSYSLNPWMLYVASAAQILLQLWWLLCTPYAPILAPSDLEVAEPLLEPSTKRKHDDSRERPIAELPKESWQILLSYMPYYVLGNACLGAWATAYWYNHISLAQIILFVAIASQLCPIWFTLKNAAREQKNTRADGWTTMIVAKVLLGTLVMYLWKTWGAIDTPVPPSIPQKVHSGIVFVFYTITSGPDPTLGLVLIYVLLTLWLGPYQNAGWHNFFIIQSLILAVLLILERLLSRLNLNTDNQTSTSDIPNEPDIGYGYGYEDSFTSPTPRRSRDSNSSACGHTDG